jgi:mannitol-specific phosphotransferase system IIBC component
MLLNHINYGIFCWIRAACHAIDGISLCVLLESVPTYILIGVFFAYATFEFALS